MQGQIPLLVVAGPTATGKTKLAVELCQRLGGEAVSADSMQIYRHMDIGTAKPTPQEMRGIPHHMMDMIEPGSSYSVAGYVADARAVIEDIHKRGKLPVLVGGTGLYISSLIDNIQFPDIKSDEEVRRGLMEKARQRGGEALLAELRDFDPETADTLHPNNVGRIIRAIEVYRLTGQTMARHRLLSRRHPSRYRLCMLALTCHDREALYRRINRRVNAMVQEGLLEETRALLAKGLSPTALQAIGYKELIGFLQGEASLEDALEDLKRATRRYAKRQLTWFRHDGRYQWIYVDDSGPEKVLQQALSFVEIFGLP